MPDKYDGSGSWVDFGEEMAKFLVSLRGRARESYTDLPPECRRDFHQLTRTLAKRFGLEARSDLYLAELRARTLQKGKPFGNCVRRSGAWWDKHTRTYR